MVDRPGFIVAICYSCMVLAIGCRESTPWSIDPDREQQLNKALASPSLKMTIEPVDNFYWQQYDERVGGK